MLYKNYNLYKFIHIIDSTSTHGFIWNTKPSLITFSAAHWWRRFWYPASPRCSERSSLLCCPRSGRWASAWGGGRRGSPWDVHRGKESPGPHRRRKRWHTCASRLAALPVMGGGWCCVWKFLVYSFITEIRQRLDFSVVYDRFLFDCT